MSDHALQTFSDIRVRERLFLFGRLRGHFTQMEINLNVIIAPVGLSHLVSLQCSHLVEYQIANNQDALRLSENTTVGCAAGSGAKCHLHPRRQHSALNLIIGQLYMQRISLFATLKG